MPTSLTGDWNKPTQVLTSIKEMDLEEVVDALNEELLAYIKDLVLAGRLELKPLSKEYASRKQKQGARPTLVRTGKYIEGLTVTKVKISDKRISYLIGAAEADKYDEAITMARLANWLENGTVYMSPRPHFKPAWKQYKDRYISLLKLGVKARIQKSM